MVTQPDPSQNNKQKAPWRLIHPPELHLETQPHVNFSSVLAHLKTKTPLTFKDKLKVLDLILWWTWAGTFLRLILWISWAESSITWNELKCLILTAEYKRRFIKDEDSSNGL